MLGYVYAVLMVVLLVRFERHAPAEALAGLALGSAASAAFLRHALPHVAGGWKHALAWPLGSLVCVAVFMADPAAHTGLITRAALYLSGESAPYSWRGWERADPAMR
jgi:hypothetical protein